MVKNVLYLAIFTFIVILSWIAFGVYHNHTASTITNDAQILITPIEPQFDNETIENIRQRNIIQANLELLRVDTVEPQTPTGSTPGAGLVGQVASESAPFVLPQEQVGL